MFISLLEDFDSKFDQVLLCDRVLFDKPLEERKQLSNLQLENLIKYLQPLIKQSIEHATKNRCKFKPINQHFAPTCPTIPLELWELLL